MNGVRGYELPTADLLEGIVFEDGPGSKIDFDIPVASACEGVWAHLQEWQAFSTVRGHGLYDAVSRGDREGIAWPEIKRYMAQYPELTPDDRADVICRVFEQKVKDFLSFLKEEKTFGDVSAVPYTIEFQKRGLPHFHTLLWVDSKNEMPDAQQIDNYISAKIPDSVQDPKGYKLVTKLMMHGPYVPASPSAACMQEGSCSKHFSKTYNDRTFFDNNGHTHYRKKDTGVYVMKGESKLDNCNVVPYNCALCLALEAHINVEYCGWSMLLKYLFKYISKGPDRILAKISNSDKSTMTTGNISHIDEIQNYVDGRFICPYEACWRIFDFPIHSREPAVQILNVHLENMQRVNFHESDRLGIIVNLPEKKKMTLTEWFVYNNENTDGRHLTYLDFPSEFVWVHPKKNSLSCHHRQIHIKKGASKEELIAASIAKSHLWPYFKVCTLKENLWLLRSGLKSEQQRRSEQFSKWLLDVGNGEIGEPDAENEQDSSWVTIPPEYTVTTDEAGMSELIDFIYDDTR
ncbi:DNA helicase [Tanacetum coccineum]